MECMHGVHDASDLKWLGFAQRMAMDGFLCHALHVKFPKMRICQLANFPIRAGFSRRYLTRSFSLTSRIRWRRVYWHNRRNTHKGKASFNFKNKGLYFVPFFLPQQQDGQLKIMTFSLRQRKSHQMNYWFDLSEDKSYWAKNCSVAWETNQKNEKKNRKSPINFLLIPRINRMLSLDWWP